jgi:hypothetical protein
MLQNKVLQKGNKATIVRIHFVTWTLSPALKVNYFEKFTCIFFIHSAHLSLLLLSKSTGLHRAGAQKIKTTEMESLAVGLFKPPDTAASQN